MYARFNSIFWLLFGAVSWGSYGPIIKYALNMHCFQGLEPLASAVICRIKLVFHSSLYCNYARTFFVHETLAKQDEWVKTKRKL
uniref:Putative secreted protein n=1 Tax=Rhipicephalus microplus TaxID=6941 RepID=A0A6G5A3H6_RHIMP